ncbi:hypothetical protein WA026_002202, partial [Henosepilachna vigintioctopunctata]
NLTTSSELEGVMRGVMKTDMKIRDNYGTAKIQSIGGYYTLLNILFISSVLLIETFGKMEQFELLQAILLCFLLLKEALDYDFMAITSKKIRTLFVILNNQMQQSCSRTLNEKTSNSKIQSIAEYDKNSNDLNRKLFLIRQISLDHYSLVSYVEELASLFSFNLALRLIRSLISAVNVLYFLIVELQDSDKEWFIVGQFLWCSYTLSHISYVLYIWDSLTREVSIL